MLSAQKFEYSEGKTLSMSSGIFGYVDNLNDLIAKNLKFFMERPGSMYPNANALAVQAKVAPNTVRNLLDNKKRTTTSKKAVGYPTLDKLERLARHLPGCEVWMLLHPNVTQAIKETELYKRIQADFEQLPEIEGGKNEKATASVGRTRR